MISFFGKWKGPLDDHTSRSGFIRKRPPYMFCRLALLGFPGRSVDKESTCNAGDPISIPGPGKSPGEGIGYPLQYSWASQVAQVVKNPPAMRETWVQSLGWQDPLEEGMATHSSVLAWRIPRPEEPGGLQSMGSQRVGHDWATKQTHTCSVKLLCLGRGVLWFIIYRF